MTDSRPDPDEAEVQKLKTIAGRMTDDDFLRDEPPVNLWSSISMAVDPPASPVTTLRRPKQRAWLAAAAVIVALAVGGWLLARGGTSDDVLASTALSNKGLSPLGANSSGSAEIVRHDGSYRLHIDLHGVPNEPSSYVELWLIDPQVKGMISLGPFHGDGDYVIPAGVDPEKYPIVDVSIEPADGVPTHSGVSIVRGVAAV